MKLQNKKGFTLIELLVVITIIGILATGATATYTGQIQKARDTTRINDIKAIQGAIEQAYGDLSFYPGVNNVASPNCTPTSTNANLKCLTSLGFIGKLPKDPKSGIIGNGSALEYTYATGPMGNVPKQAFEISMGMESSGQKLKAGSGADNGNDDNRYEVGHVSAGINTRTAGATAVAVAAIPVTYGTTTQSTAVAISTTVLSCGIVGTTPATSADSSTNQSNVAVIKGPCGF